MKITRAPILILVVAFCVRAGWALFVPVMPLSDSYAYDTFAQNLANGLGYGWNAGEPTVFWMPGTAMVYALFYRTFGHAYSPIVILNVLLGVWIVLAAMWLSEKWFDARTGLVTGWLLALWPNLIQFTTILASELLFMALVLAALLLWQFWQRVWWQRAGAIGIVLACAVYVRSIGLLVPAALLRLDWMEPRRKRTSIPTFVVTLLVMFVLIAPWSVRNTMTFHTFVPLGTNGGFVLLQGIRQDPFEAQSFEIPRPPEMNEAQFDEYTAAQARTLLLANPMQSVVRLVRRVVFLYSRESIGVVWNGPALTTQYGAQILTPLKIINVLFWYFVLGSSFAGFGWLARQRGWFAALLHPVVVMQVVLVLSVALGSATDRYHIPGTPFLAMLAAFGLTASARWLVHL